MDAKCLERERRVAEIAARQHGVIGHAQAVALGFGRGAIRRRLEAGRWHRLHCGVYAVGHVRLSVRGRWMAGVLACGDGALLSHRSAASLWDLLPIRGGRVDVLVQKRGPRRKAAIAMHETLRLHPRDRAIRDAIPVTSVARTLLDVAETESATTLRRAWDTAERLRLLDTRRVAETCRRSPCRRGLKLLNALLAERRATPNTKRELEARFFDFCHDHGLPLPSCNVLVEGFEVDAYWPAHNLVVELDSWEFHRGRAAFEQDRERDAALHAADHRPIRITWRRLTGRPDELAAQLRRLLS